MFERTDVPLKQIPLSYKEEQPPGSLTQSEPQLWGLFFGGGGYQRVAQVQVPAVMHRLQAEQTSHVRGITPFASSLWGLKVSCGLWGPCSARSNMDLSLSAAPKGLWGERALGCKRQKKN